MNPLAGILSKVVTQVIIGLVIAGLAGGLLKSCSNLKKERWLNEETKEHYSARMVKETNKFGHAVASRNQAQVDLATFKSIMGDKYDSIIAAGAVKDKRLATYTAINAALHLQIRGLELRPADTIIKVLPGGDTVYIAQRTFEQGNRWYHIQGTVGDGPHGTLSIDSLGISTPISIYGTVRREHGKLFGARRFWVPRWGPKDYEIKVTSPNPYFVVDSIVSFNLEKR